MTYQNGRYYNDNNKSAVVNECLRIWNPSERTVTVRNADGSETTTRCMISRAGVLMANSEKPLLNSASVPDGFDEMDEQGLLFGGGIEEYVLRLGENEGGRTVTAEGDPHAHESIEGYRAPALHDADTDRPRALQEEMRRAHMVYSKSVEALEEAEFWRMHHA